MPDSLRSRGQSGAWNHGKGETCASGNGELWRGGSPPARWSCRSALTFGAARAQDKTYVMKITLPTINDTPHQLAKNFAAAVEKDSGGRIKGEVYPASQLGSIPRQIEGVQFGAIQVRSFRRSSSSASTSASR